MRVNGNNFINVRYTDATVFTAGSETELQSSPNSVAEENGKRDLELGAWL